MFESWMDFSLFSKQDGEFNMFRFNAKCLEECWIN